MKAGELIMYCEKPRKIVVKGEYRKAVRNNHSALFPCGKCINCRVNQANVWKGRIILEQTMHPDSCFVTLTFDDDHIPDPAHVDKAVLQDYVKRLRKIVAPTLFRYYGVGEFGDKSFRPHYHIVLFGLSILEHRKQIREAWQNNGFIDIGELNHKSANYITGYITKKVLKDLNKHPTSYGKPDEFAIMSRGTRKESMFRGGIGAPAIEKIKEKMAENSWYKEQLIASLKVGKGHLPLGRYLKLKMNDWQDTNFADRLVRFFLNQERQNEKYKKQVRGSRYVRKTSI